MSEKYVRKGGLEKNARRKSRVDPAGSSFCRNTRLLVGTAVSRARLFLCDVVHRQARGHASRDSMIDRVRPCACWRGMLQSGPWPSWRSAVALSANSRASTIASVDDCRWFSADQTGKRLNLRPRFAFSFPSSYVDILRLTQYVMRSWAATRWYFFGGSRLIVRNNQTCSLNFVEGAIGRLRACSGHWRPEKMSNSFTLFFNFVRKDNVNPRETAANDECGNPWMIGSTPPIRRFLCYFDKRWGQQRKVLGMLD